MKNQKSRAERGIYWDRPLKLVEGCTAVSPGCRHCWSARETWMRRMNPMFSETVRTAMNWVMNDGKFNGKIAVRPDNLTIPLKTKRATTWLVLNDLFHEDAPRFFISAAVAMMHETPQHTYIILTKRPKIMNAAVPLNRWAPNMWPGVSVENQEAANLRIPEFLYKNGALIKIISVEPMLGPIVFEEAMADWWESSYCPQWVILGGESGPEARPMHPDWARSVRDQCAAAGVPFFFKQWGEWAPGGRIGKLEYCWGDGLTSVRIGTKAAGRLLDGRTWDQKI